MAAADWWRGAVIYEIYPRSFLDTSGDGVGDLNGITQRLDYVAELGVDAVWVAPFFTSPMLDFGYDVADFVSVDPLFGTLDDFDRLVDRAHALGLKVMIDQVVSHTASMHPWFQESRASRDNSKADWYVWADAKPDDTPPNNWLSVFGGAAWQWFARRRQYYLHNFLSDQPDLNFHCDPMVTTLLGQMEFWLRHGVDGFRLDTANFYTHDAKLRDNPAQDPGVILGLSHERRANPYFWQRHVYDKSRPENLKFLARLRSMADRYGAVTLGEVSDDDSLSTAAAYTRGDRHLHMAYTFDLLSTDYSAAYIRERVEYLERRIGDGWLCWSFSNHDVRRAVSRWCVGQVNDAQAKMLLALLLALRGSPCVYQGEELALPQAEIALDQMRDPIGRTFYPEPVGRDGCRTPMPWSQNALHGGFSHSQPWLPVPQSHRERAVDLQEADANSVLQMSRRFLAWRKAQPALVNGSIRFLDVPEPGLAFVRATENQRILAVFNLGPSALRVAPPPCGPCQSLRGHGFSGSIVNEEINLPPYGAYFGSLSENWVDMDG